MKRQKYQMSEEDHVELMKACQPVPMIMLQCGTPRSPQQNANDAWEHLGKKMGFQHMTVQPDGNDSHNFTAVPTDDLKAAK